LTDEQILGMDEGLGITGAPRADQATEGSASQRNAEANAADPFTSSFDDEVMAGNGALVAERLAQINGTGGAARESGAPAGDATSGGGAADRRG
jgi:hypothetical protein